MRYAAPIAGRVRSASGSGCPAAICRLNCMPTASSSLRTTSPCTSRCADPRHMNILACSTEPAGSRFVGNRQLDRFVDSAADPGGDRAPCLTCHRQHSGEMAVFASSSSCATSGFGEASDGTMGGVKPASSISQSDEAPLAITAERTASRASSRRMRASGPFQHRAIGAGHGAPVYPELPCNSGELGASTTIRPPGPGPGPSTRSAFAPASLNRSRRNTLRPVQRDHGAQRGAFGRRGTKERRQPGKPCQISSRMVGYRRLVRVESMSSLVVITRLFIS